MSPQSNKRSEQIASDQALIAGIQKFLMSYPSLTVGSQTLTPAALVQLLQNRINANQAAQTADAARTAAVQANRDERAETAAVRQSLRLLVLAMYSHSPDTLAVFGLKPRPPSKKTVATKAEAQVKAKATRKARNTMGPKQKLGITGTTTTASSGSSTPPAPPASPKT
jgi:hypothetical protein